MQYEVQERFGHLLVQGAPPRWTLQEPVGSRQGETPTLRIPPQRPEQQGDSRLQGFVCNMMLRSIFDTYLSKSPRNAGLCKSPWDPARGGPPPSDPSPKASGAG